MLPVISVFGTCWGWDGEAEDTRQMLRHRRPGILQRLSLPKLRINGTASRARAGVGGRSPSESYKRPIRQVRHMTAMESRSVPGEEETT